MHTRTGANDVLDIFYENPFIGEFQLRTSQSQRFKINPSFKKQDHMKLTITIVPTNPVAQTSQPASQTCDQIKSSSLSEPSIPTQLRLDLGS